MDALAMPRTLIWWSTGERDFEQMQPKVIDNDKDEITVSLDGRELRGWSYSTDGERRQKMVQAREYVEGWCDGQETKQ